MFLFFILVSIELIAEEIEDPFGNDENDLPTNELTFTIMRDVSKAFEVGDEILPRKIEELH
jgi:putative membrane protein